MIQTRSGITLVAVTNTQAGGSAVVVTNSQNLGVNIQNSAGWVVYIANTVAGGDAVTITNSAGWIVAISNTSPLVSIVNSAGWIMAQSNTSPLVQVTNSAGWIFAQSNTSSLTQVTNSAGWSVFAIDSAPTSSVVTAVASTIGTVVLSVAQTKRVNLSIYNASTQVLYMKLGSGAKSTDFTLMMVSSGFYELPRPVYNGQITGVWPSANGFAYVSENT